MELNVTSAGTVSDTVVELQTKIYHHSSTDIVPPYLLTVTYNGPVGWGMSFGWPYCAPTDYSDRRKQKRDK